MFRVYSLSAKMMKIHALIKSGASNNRNQHDQAQPHFAGGIAFTISDATVLMFS